MNKANSLLSKSLTSQIKDITTMLQAKKSLLKQNGGMKFGLFRKIWLSGLILRSLGAGATLTGTIFVPLSGTMPAISFNTLRKYMV
ncbi:MAG: hypothetical protein OXD32_07745 [Endozoicomonadaceae bacterium]|nr:hypothetical protein [Endozoicomonadaceae bacterium]MCY4328966.1 hypothetical protein [Endozoicomonadaceae bacterium]